MSFSPGSLDRADYEIVYHHLMTPQLSKGHFEIPSKKSLLKEVHGTRFVFYSLCLQSSLRWGTFIHFSFTKLPTDINCHSDTVGNTPTLETFWFSAMSVFAKLVDELMKAWLNEDELRGAGEIALSGVISLIISTLY